MSAHARLKNECTEDKKYHNLNLKRWLNSDLYTSECPKPTVPENVIILGNRYGVGRRLSSICARGYAPAIGVGVSRVCLPTGQWSGKDPVCALGIP